MSRISSKKDDTPKTYGEKMHSRIFDVGINFGANLLVSAAFTYWVRHSTKTIGSLAPLKNIRPKEGTFWHKALNKSPSAFYEQVVNTFHKSPLLTIVENEKSRRGVAEAMANIFTLNFGGHGVIIPSVWLGEKYKNRIIEHFDRKHYGDKAEQPEWVKARHEAIQNTPKPSFLGSIAGRTGTMFATVGVAYTLGARDNVIKEIGKAVNSKTLQKFNGLDPTSEKWGTIVGHKIKDALPKHSNEKINRYMREKGFGHSIDQAAQITGMDAAENFAKLEAARIAKTGPAGTHAYGGKSGSVIPDFTRFTFLDTMTTVVTAGLIGPITRGLQKLPGMSYKQESYDAKKDKTVGERVHNAVTYGGVDFLLNAGIGASFAFAVNRVPFGQRYYKQPVEKLLKNVNKHFVSETNLQKSVERGQNLISIAIGGTAINPLLTRLEKPENKEAFVKKVNETVYGKWEVAHNPRFEGVKERIYDQPEKSLTAAWVSRLVSLAPIYYIASQPQLLKGFKSNNLPVVKHISFDSIGSFTKRVASKVGIKPKGWWNETYTNADGITQTNWNGLHNDFIGFDFGFTIPYMFLHAATFPIASDLIDRKKKDKDTPPTAAPSADMPTHTTAPKKRAANQIATDMVLNAIETAEASATTPTATPPSPSNAVCDITSVERLINEPELQVAH
jgi:hypothetical protein